jgi:hypothetical protein
VDELGDQGQWQTVFQAGTLASSNEPRKHLIDVPSFQSQANGLISMLQVMKWWLIWLTHALGKGKFVSMLN